MKKNDGLKIILDTIKVLFTIKKNLAGDIKNLAVKQDVSRSEVISMLYIYIEGKKNMSQLCEDVDLKSGSLTSVIDSLVSKGYVRREYDPGDRRKIMVELTARGREFAKKICKSVQDNAWKKLEKLDELEKGEFFKAIDTLRSMAEEV
ncbi:MAG: MarR family transcriptional regulator [Actinomycetota bacterium]|nr:MarR family transcriptional regulator [Actinomycetota bacterium]